MLYTDVMHSCAGLLAVGFLANAAVRPVNPKYHMPEPAPAAASEAPTAAGADGEGSDTERLHDPWDDREQQQRDDGAAGEGTKPGPPRT